MGNSKKEVLSILDKTHPLLRTCKGPDILLELAMFKKIENFDNVAEFVLLKALFFKH